MLSRENPRLACPPVSRQIRPIVGFPSGFKYPSSLQDLPSKLLATTVSTLFPRATMRVPLLPFVLIVAVVATTVSLVPAVCNGQEAATAGEEHGGSIKPLSLDGYGPLEKAAKKPKEQTLNAQASPAVPADTYDQKPDKYVASSLVPAKEEEETPAEVKKEKKEKSDYLDESTSSKKEKKEKSDDSDVSTSSKKKKKKAKTDDSDEDASLTKKEKKEKKHKKHKSDDDDLDSTSPKKHKKEKSIDSDASSYLQKEEEKSGGDSDEATSLKKHKKEKKNKKKKEEKSGENADEDDAAPVDVSTDGQYVSPSSKEEKSDEDDAMPVDVSTTTGQYVSSPKSKGGERQVSTPTDAYTSPDELPPAAKSSTTSDAYAPPKQQVVSSSSSSSQPIAGGSPDELPPAAKSSATADPYLSSKHQVVSSQPMAGGAPDEVPPNVAANGQPNLPAAGNKPKLSMGTLSGMIKKPIAKFLSPVIKSVCAKTEYPVDCEASIGGLPGAASAAATDSVGVLKLAMEAVRQKVIVAMNAATDRMNAPGVDGTTKDALDSCTSSYSDIKTSLDSVDDALKRGDVDTAHTNLDSVETDLTTCDDGFQEHGIPSVMTDHDQELQKLASNLLSIGAAIHR